MLVENRDAVGTRWSAEKIQNQRSAGFERGGTSSGSSGVFLYSTEHSLRRSMLSDAAPHVDRRERAEHCLSQHLP
jgi:hypothetical protein